ncbi:MAG TPA: serine/threonine-protein kinase, partial [Gemmatimonadaceae bacterium]|nr:serine/threonine-protein kinase [Gemmatimonadaceae bacterium]
MRQLHRDETFGPRSTALAALGARYDVERELGRGGMAVVYLARERQGGRRVAIKLISARYSGDAEAVHRFAREARTAAALQHPNIVRTLAIEELGAGDALAIVTAFVPGDTLRDVLASAGAFSFDRAASVLRDVAAALAHAHEMRIVHRDVKPENIFLVGDPGRALLADFGIARELDSDTLLTVDGSAIGTPMYMSPEQVDGLPVDGRTDIYSLGLVGWEMLTGERPWQGETLYAVLHKQKHERLPGLAELRPDIPAYLLTAIEGALEKDPARRWQSASEMLRRLTPAPARLPRVAPDGAAHVAAEDDTDDVRGGASTALPTVEMRVPRRSRPRRPRRPTRRAWVVAVAVILVVIATALSVALAGREGDGSVARASPDTTLAEDLAR